MGHRFTAVHESSCHQALAVRGELENQSIVCLKDRTVARPEQELSGDLRDGEHDDTRKGEQKDAAGDPSRQQHAKSECDADSGDQHLDPTKSGRASVERVIGDRIQDQ